MSELSERRAALRDQCNALRLQIPAGERATVAQRAALSLAFGVLRTGAMDRHELQPAAFTIGVLSGVRSVMRRMNDGAVAWTNPDPMVLRNLERYAETQARRAVMLTLNTEPGARRFFRQQKRLAQYRPQDLRWTRPLPQDTPVPFGEELPEFETEEMIGTVSDVAQEIWEMVALSVGPDATPAEKTLEPIVFALTAGKCALSAWRAPRVVAFLDTLSCLDGDADFSEMESGG